MNEKIEQTILTEEGYKKLADELDYLKSTRREEVTEDLRVARSFGDYSENAELDIAKEEKKNLEERISLLEMQLKNAQIIKSDKGRKKNNKVTLGSKVKVLDIEYDEEMEFQLVGTVEANPKKNRISNESPLGSKLLGAKVGETITVETASTNIEYKLLEILN